MIEFQVSVWNFFSTCNVHSITFLDDNVTISILNHINDGRIGIVYRNTAEVWGSCQVQKDFVEMLNCETSKTLLDGFFRTKSLGAF